jgi:hypothetical protein
VSTDHPLWMTWFVLRWGAAGMAACLVVVPAAERLWGTLPDLVNVIIGGLFVFASWFVGALWTIHREGL